MNDEKNEHNYWGYMEEIKPTYGVHYMVLDEYIIRSVEKQSNSLKKELGNVISCFRKELETEVKYTRDKIDTLEKENTRLYKIIKKIADHNKIIIEEKTHDNPAKPKKPAPFKRKDSVHE